MPNERKQKVKLRNIFVVILGVASLIFLALAPIFNFIPSLIYNFNVYYINALINGIDWSLCVAILPISLLLLCTSTKKKGLSIIFIIVSVLCIGTQLLGIVLAFLKTWLNLNAFIDIIVNSIPGSNLLSCIWHTFGTPLTYWDLSFLIQRLSYSLSDILYILPSLLCLVGFVILALSKKPSNEPEIAATEACVKAESDASAEVCKPFEPEDSKEVQPLVKAKAAVNPSAEDACFCRKCGTKLQSDSDFCHKCGAEAIR